jgi:hypothetical protein
MRDSTVAIGVTVPSSFKVSGISPKVTVATLTTCAVGAGFAFLPPTK